MQATFILSAISVSDFLSALIILIRATPAQVMPPQWLLVLGYGGFIAVSTLGTRYLASAEVSLLIVSKSVAAPLLVWTGLGEDPGP